MIVNAWTLFTQKLNGCMYFFKVLNAYESYLSCLLSHVEKKSVKQIKTFLNEFFFWCSTQEECFRILDIQWLLLFMKICHSMAISTHYETVHVTKILGVYLCTTLGITSVYKPPGFEFEYSKDFWFNEGQYIFKSWFTPQNWTFQHVD